jgi:cysteine desulfurase
MEKESTRLRGLRDRLLTGIEGALDGVHVNGSMAHRLPHNLNLSFAHVDSESLLMGLHDVALSTGSACSSATIEPSHVLRALGTGDDLAHGAVRFGLGRFNTEEEVDYVVERLAAVVRNLRDLSPASTVKNLL